MAIDESDFTRDENGQVILMGLRSIKPSDKVVTTSYDEHPLINPHLGKLLPTHDIIPLYLETEARYSANDAGILQLFLTMKQARELSTQILHLLDEHEPRQDYPTSIN